MEITKQLVTSARTLQNVVNTLTFSPSVTHVYNPLDYAWEAHKQYLTKYANSTKKVIMLGMNPGPFGMARTLAPFGEIAAAHDWRRTTWPNSSGNRNRP